MALQVGRSRECKANILRQISTKDSTFPWCYCKLDQKIACSAISIIQCFVALQHISPTKVEFTQFQVYTPSQILNQSHVIMMFKSGAGVEVIENKHYMAARVFLPWEFVVSNFLNISLIFRTLQLLSVSLNQPGNQQFCLNHFQNMTRGLMGNWTFDIQDDFTLPDGSEKTVYQTSDLKNLHDEFAMECKSVCFKHHFNECMPFKI